VDRELLKQLRLPGRRRSGRLADPGHDHALGHRTYVSTLASGDAEWLRTKPFSAPPGPELAACLRTFVNVVTQLDLGLRAQVLDAGCGPGWLSELLAACGYWVTGIDVSEDMVEIARARVASVRPLAAGFEPVAEFVAAPVRSLPWRDRFDAIVLYDALHHFDEEGATLRALLGSLVPGGTLFIRDAVRPAPGSRGERELHDEMRRHGTLESPFDPEYLEQVVREAGFVEVRQFLEIDGLFDLADAKRLGRIVAHYLAARFGLAAPPSNMLVARRPGGVDIAFSAVLRRVGPWRSEDGERALTIEATNVGRCYWPAAPEEAIVAGAVSVGAWLAPVTGGWVELPRTALADPVPPGRSTELVVPVPAYASGTVTIDLVREGIGRFAEYGSAPLRIDVP